MIHESAQKEKRRRAFDKNKMIEMLKGFLTDEEIEALFNLMIHGRK